MALDSPILAQPVNTLTLSPGSSVTLQGNLNTVNLLVNTIDAEGHISNPHIILNFCTLEFEHLLIDGVEVMGASLHTLIDMEIAEFA